MKYRIYDKREDKSKKRKHRNERYDLRKQTLEN